MRRKRSFVPAALAAVLVAVLPLPAQEEEAAAFFSLASSRTYGPADKPAVQLYSHGAGTLQFRLYRVQNPTKFFEGLTDFHSFGEMQRVPEAHKAALTPIERFHEFKRAWRVRVRNAFRAQFTAENRSVIRAGLSERSRGGPATRSYAEVPVLNPNQLIRVWEQPAGGANRWNAETVTIPTPGAGVYLVEATNGKLRAFTLVQVSDLVLLNKSVPGRLVTQVVNRATGEPVAGCALLLRTRDKELGRAATNIDGTAEFSITERQLEQVIVMANKGGQFTADALYGYSLSTGERRAWMGYVYTDRPVYRPGHTVNYRAVIREMAGAAYKMPGVSEVDVEVNDNEGKPVTRQKAQVSAFGTVHGSFDLPANTSLGYYFLQVKSGTSQAGGGFEVREYKKPEYEVKVLPEQRRVLQGTPIKATIQARYYFGEPVANAKVTWVVHKSRYWYPLYAEDFDADDSGDEGGGGFYGSEQVAEESGQTDGEGKLAVSFPNGPEANDLIYRIEARVTDQSNREIAGNAAVIATVGSFLIHAVPEQYVYAAGDTAGISIEARDYDGNPVAADYSVTVNEYRWNRGALGQVASGRGNTGAQGRSRFEFKIPAAGAYQATITAVTPEKREVRGEVFLWVAGGGEFWSGGESRQRIQIVPDKRSYAPGDKAKILVVTGIPKAAVLVTIEGRDLFRTQVVRATSPAFTVEVPVGVQHEPNFFFTASVVRDGQWMQGMKSVRVPPNDHKLSVQVKASKAEYKPGEAASIEVEARDHAGKPAAAEFSLGVVDEAIYAIRKDMTPDAVSFFYGRGWNRVATSTSLTYYFQGQAGRRAMQLAQVKRHSLAQLKPEKLVDAKVRKAFPDTAFWSATLRTGANGRAEAKFDFPDALTTWRATARGVTEETAVGNAVSRVVVRKNLILRLATPRFFRDGDEVTVPALVHNYLATAKTVRVSLEARGADLLEGGTKDVSVAAKGEARVEYRLRARPGANVVLLGKALTDEESDALELTLPVVPYGIRLSDARSGSVTDENGAAETAVAVPAESAAWSRSLEITLTPSIAGTIFGALDYLTSFPYGCVEQTMSSFLPNVIVSRAARQLGIKSGIDEAELGRKIRAGLERLYGFQHEDGGWGWWQGDESHPFMTPYVVAGLLEARNAGERVRNNAVGKGAAWLKRALQEGKANPDQRAYMLYALALAGQTDAAMQDAVWNARGKMTPYGAALLGLAMRAVHDGRAAEAAAQLEAAAKSSESEAWWPADRDQLLDFSADATPEATAYAMKLLTAERPQSPLLAKAAAWLVNHRGGGYYWNTTKQTAMVVYGLTDYVKLGNELKPDFSFTVSVNGKQVASRKFTAADAVAPAPFSVKMPADQVPSGLTRIRLTKSGGGRLYWSARADYFTQNAPPLRDSGGLALQRDYYRAVPVRRGEKIVYRLEPLAGSVLPGEIIAVRLTLAGAGFPYLLVEDPIPAGAEFIEHDELYELAERPDWWSRWLTRREFHDDRAALFQTYPVKNRQDFTYLLKVVNSGKFRISPAKAGPMYLPGVMATTGSRDMEVR